MDFKPLHDALAAAQEALGKCRALEASLARAEEMRGTVRPAAFARVEADYRQRLARAQIELVTRRQTALTKLDEARRGLPALVARAERLEEERDELVLRAHLGELPAAQGQADALQAEAAEARRIVAELEGVAHAAVARLGLETSVKDLVANLAAETASAEDPSGRVPPPDVGAADLTDVISGGVLHFASGVVRPVGFGRTVVGAADDANIVLRDASIHPRHAEITFEDGRHVVSAIDGALSVEGVACEVAVLADGTRLEFGGVAAVFRTSGDGTPVDGAPAAGTSATVLTTRSQVEMAIAGTSSGHQDTFVISRPLLVIREAGQTRSVRLDLGQVQIGSAADDDLRIEGIRPHHAVIRFENDGFAVAAEAGPVQLNGRHVRSAALADGDVIRMGAVEIQYAESSFRDT